jgi:hypothetical protein
MSKAASPTRERSTPEGKEEEREAGGASDVSRFSVAAKMRGAFREANAVDVGD